MHTGGLCKEISKYKNDWKQSFRKHITGHSLSPSPQKPVGDQITDFLNILDHRQDPKWLGMKSRYSMTSVFPWSHRWLHLVLFSNWFCDSTVIFTTRLYVWCITGRGGKSSHDVLKPYRRRKHKMAQSRICSMPNNTSVSFHLEAVGRGTVL